MHLDAVEGPFSRVCGQVGQYGGVLFDRIRVTILQPRDLSTNGVQAVVLGIQMGGTVEKLVGLLDRTDGNVGLRRRKLQRQILGHGIGRLGVEPGGFGRLAVELIGVRELSQHVRPRIANGFERGNRLGVASGLQEIAGQRTLDLGIVRGAPLGHFQIVVCLIELLQMLVGERHQHL